MRYLDEAAGSLFCLRRVFVYGMGKSGSRAFYGNNIPSNGNGNSYFVNTSLMRNFTLCNFVLPSRHCSIVTHNIFSFRAHVSSLLVITP